LTVNGGDYFAVGGGTIVLYNSIFTDLEVLGGNPTLNNSYVGSSSGLFQTVGAAAHYLAAGSPHRNAGTTSGMSSTLLADLKKRTTYPPVLLFTGGTWYTNSVALSPQAQRDADTPDIGYHYDPLDYAVGSIPLTNATITVLPGTALATYDAGFGYGLALMGNSQFLCEGSPTNLNRIVRYNTVQEQANTNWSKSASSVITTWLGSANPLVLRARFTEWSRLAGGGSHLSDYYTSAAGSFALADCQFFGGGIDSTRVTIGLTNALLHRVSTLLSDNLGDFETGHSMRNCTVIGGELTHDHSAADTWTFRDNFFVGTSNVAWSGVSLDADYNGYTTNLVRLNTNATHDVLLATNAIAFQTSWLGTFYLPDTGPGTNLFNKGSTNANLLGLYHYTTTTNQVKETNTIVDIGFHYVATDANGMPVDTDGDGWPDYQEDANGNGSLDHRETKPNDPADWGLRVFITRPRNGSTIP